MDYGLHMAVTKWDEKVKKHNDFIFLSDSSILKVAEDMRFLVSEGINSFKFFMAYKVRYCSFSSVKECV